MEKKKLVPTVIFIMYYASPKSQRPFYTHFRSVIKLIKVDFGFSFFYINQLLILRNGIYRISSLRSKSFLQKISLFS